MPPFFLMMFPLAMGFAIFIWEWLAVFYLVIAIFVYISGAQKHVDLGFTIPRFPVGTMILSAGIGLGLVGAVAYLSTPDQQTMYVPDLSVPYQQYVPEEQANALSLGSQALIASVEEMFFRGFVMGNFLFPYSAMVAIPASTIMFSAAHIMTGAYIATLIGGVVFGVMVWQTRSILPSVLSHGVYNVAILSISYRYITTSTVIYLAAGVIAIGITALVMEKVTT